jgi:hypothetical protein
MKSRPDPFSWMWLLLLLGVAAWIPFLSAPWNSWLLPGLAVLALAVCLFSRALPMRLGVAGVAILGLIALYACNPTHRWSEGVGLLPVDHLRWLPGSAFSPGGWGALGLATAMVAAYALAFRLSESQIRWLQLAVMLGAAAMALAVLAQRLEPKRSPIFEYTGIFVNENHFAVFSNLILPVVLALAARARFRAVQEGKPSSPAGLFMLVAVLMGTAVGLCRSRAGVAVMALEVVAYAWLCRTLSRQYPFMDVPAPFLVKRLGGLVLLILVLLTVAAFAREWHHVDTLRGEWAFRSGILKDTLAAWRAQPAWGTGPGTFTVVFPYYQSEVFQWHAILHAHCEPIQFLSEFGLAGGLWVMLAARLGLSAPRVAAVRPEWTPSFAELERRAFALGLIACAIHSGIDFPLRTPVIALLAAAWAGVWAGHRPTWKAKKAG